jgi:Protein glycosylation ligase/O-Antigen ligase
MYFSRPVLLYIFIAAPWLNPWASGPSAAIVPWLVSLACIAATLWLAPMQVKGIQGLSRGLTLFFSAIAAYFVLHMLLHGQNVEGLATLVAWCCIAVMALIGANLSHARIPHTHHGSFEARTGRGRTPTPAIFDLQDLAWVWLSVALLSVAMALCQYVRIEHWFSPWISHSGDGTAFANLRQRNQFATLCGMGLLALLFLRQTASGTSGNRAALNALHQDAPSRPASAYTGWQTAWPWLAAMVLAIGNGLSSSRTGAVQWLLIAGLVFCWRTSLQAQVRRLGYGALGLYVLVVACMPWFANAVGNASNGLWGRAQSGVADGLGDNSRVWLYSNVLELIAQKPWLGWGWRELAYAHYSTPFTHRFGELLDNAHNLPLHLACLMPCCFVQRCWCGCCALRRGVKRRPRASWLGGC